MRVHIKNIVASAISRGLIDGFDAVKADLRRKKLTEDVEVEALGKIGLAIWEELDDAIDFSDDDDEETGPGKPAKMPMGFAATMPEPVVVDAVSDQTLPNDDDLDDDDEEDEDEDSDDDSDAIDTRSRFRSVRYRKRLETLLRSRRRRS